MTTFDQVTEYLYHQLPMYQQQGGKINFGLTKTEELLAHLGNPHHRLKCIHVAGTNGKGSTCAMLAAVLTRSGQRTGLFTSPHLHSYTERIRIDGRHIPEQWVVQWVNKLKPYIDEHGPSFFELTFAMACDYFAQHKVHIAVMEVGMGGRLDSTNVIQPILSIITNVSWDHAEYLGDTVQKIAAEKAGILKKDIPCILGQYQPEVFDVIVDEAERVGTIVYPAWYGYTCRPGDWEEGIRWFDLTHEVLLQTTELACDLAGDYQAQNIPAVMMALDMLAERGYHIREEDILMGMRNVRGLSGLCGRFDILEYEPLTVADVAHNEAGIRSLMRQVESLEMPHVHIVLGMVQEKDRSKILPLLPRDATYYFTQPPLPRALPADSLVEEANAVGLKGVAYPNVKTALAEARLAASPEDMILITGSVFVVAEVVEQVQD